MIKILQLTLTRNQNAYGQFAPKGTVVKTYSPLSYYARLDEKGVAIRSMDGINPLVFDVINLSASGISMAFGTLMISECERLGIPYMGDRFESKVLYSKINQGYRMLKNGVNYPNTIFTSNPKVLYKAIRASRGQFSYPLIVKADGSSKGNNNYLVDDERAMVILSKGLIGDYIAQNFITVNNACKGAQTFDVPLDEIPEEIEMAIAAARAVGHTYCGVDVIRDSKTGKAFVLETNAVPTLSFGVKDDCKRHLTAVYSHLLQLPSPSSETLSSTASLSSPRSSLRPRESEIAV